METIQQFSDESLSNSWLINLKPSLDALNDSLRSSLDAESFFEMDLKLISMSTNNEAAVPPIEVSSVSLDSPNSVFSISNRHWPRCFKSRCAKLVVAVQKHLGFVLMYVCKKVRRLRLVGRVAASSTGRAGGGGVERNRGRRVFDGGDESSIDEAVLHCRNSNSEFLKMGVF